VLKIFHHDKIWGDNPPAPNFGGTCPPVPRDLRPRGVGYKLHLLTGKTCARYSGRSCMSFCTTSSLTGKQDDRSRVDELHSSDELSAKCLVSELLCRQNAMLLYQTAGEQAVIELSEPDVVLLFFRHQFCCRCRCCCCCHVIFAAYLLFLPTLPDALSEKQRILVYTKCKCSSASSF